MKRETFSPVLATTERSKRKVVFSIPLFVTRSLITSLEKYWNMQLFCWYHTTKIVVGYNTTRAIKSKGGKLRKRFGCSLSFVVVIPAKTNQKMSMKDLSDRLTSKERYPDRYQYLRLKSTKLHFCWTLEKVSPWWWMIQVITDYYQARSMLRYIPTAVTTRTTTTTTTQRWQLPAPAACCYPWNLPMPQPPPPNLEFPFPPNDCIDFTAHLSSHLLVICCD